MTDFKKAAIEEIERKTAEIINVADRVWEFSELSLQEYKSAELFCKILKEEGFTVEEGISGIPTAFSASFGEGRPAIGILAEYDALSGLSQKGGSLKKEELKVGGNGHGCGHNLLGAGAFGAALGIKKYLEESHKKGKVVLYGCPGEEGLASKAFMARDGEWKKLDAALTWHPEDCNEVATGSSNSCIQSLYSFKGRASHAAGAPEKGRSALDAVELMNIGVQFLREHMSDRARVHYAITDAGGVSPNVVQPAASVLYMIRSNRVREALELKKRVDDIAKGAALMTETTYEERFIDGLSDTVSNSVLEEVLYRNFKEIPLPGYTKEEISFAEALNKTYEDNDKIPGTGSDFDREYRDSVKKIRKEHNNPAINGFLLPLYKGEAINPASTDVGDVSWLCPTAQIHTAAFPNGCPGHSWQNVSIGATSIAHKALLLSSKVLCASAIDLFEDEGILKRAREEFEERTAEGYFCPVPEGAKPALSF